MSVLEDLTGKLSDLVFAPAVMTANVGSSRAQSVTAAAGKAASEGRWLALPVAGVSDTIGPPRRGPAATESNTE